MNMMIVVVNKKGRAGFMPFLFDYLRTAATATSTGNARTVIAACANSAMRCSGSASAFLCFHCFFVFDFLNNLITQSYFASEGSLLHLKVVDVYNSLPGVKCNCYNFTFNTKTSCSLPKHPCTSVLPA